MGKLRYKRTYIYNYLRITLFEFHRRSLSLNAISYKALQMDNNNRQTAEGHILMPGQVIGGDWRTQLQQDSRHRIINKITETLKRHLPFSGEEGLQELNKIAVRFEEKIYTAATSQSDYLRKISLKMLTMETKSQNSLNSKNPQDTVLAAAGQYLLTDDPEISNLSSALLNMPPLGSPSMDE
ncbi:mediator of RNA polymerase II transcription subunit 15a-like isoform X2 [Salvia hispanica]|uniref:mediator of RNA polymerase II transcription subunit 15a-like isoform X2 n=1 Tax=Salvia hispanica TaxID=49212 RepID=UPI002009B938|nr:mediator of RNA polymerase II transcription subunit 15a-like isoform X2 [Salvia hispanica]